MSTALRRLLTLALCVGLGAAFPRAQAVQEPTAALTFRSAVDLVTIQASVRDGRGRVITGLTPTDFEVFDNGAPQSILSLRADRQSPLTLAILVDMSGSMSIAPKIAMTREAYRSLLVQLRPG